MNYQNGIISAVAVLLCLITLSGMLFTDHFPQAVHAESVGFDALAHHLFDSALPSRAEGKPRTSLLAV